MGSVPECASCFRDLAPAGIQPGEGTRDSIQSRSRLDEQRLPARKRPIATLSIFEKSTMKLDSPVYLDYNGTTPIDPEVAQALLPYLTEHFGNPSSTHAYGHLVRNAIDAARRSVAELIGGSPDEIIFTGGGSESDNLAIQGVAMALKNRGDHIITQQTEHPAVLK